MVSLASGGVSPLILRFIRGLTPPAHQHFDRAKRLLTGRRESANIRELFRPPPAAMIDGKKTVPIPLRPGSQRMPPSCQRKPSCALRPNPASSRLRTVSDRRADVDAEDGPRRRPVAGARLRGAAAVRAGELGLADQRRRGPRPARPGRDPRRLLQRRPARWLIAGNADSQRLFDEEIDGLGFQLKEWPWHWGRDRLLTELCHGPARGVGPAVRRVPRRGRRGAPAAAVADGLRTGLPADAGARRSATPWKRPAATSPPTTRSARRPARSPTA